MFGAIVIIALIICVALILFILVQNPKGGGLSGTFGGAANQLFGYSRSADGIEKWTWYMICAVFVLCLTSSAFKPAETDISDTLPASEAQPSSIVMPETTSDESTPAITDPQQTSDEASSTDDGTQP